jgi:ABC-2 family transporter protein
MIWYTWRQTRIPLLIGLITTFALAIALVIVGQHLYQDVHALQNPLCQQIDQCREQGEDLGSTFVLFHNISICLLSLPALVGIFIGAPLVAGEYEQRTYRFIWTQGITRRRWLTLHLIPLFSVVMALTAVMSLLVNWGISSQLVPNNLSSGASDRFSLWGFDLSGITPVAYAAFALALGIASGALLRRTLPAMAVTLAGYIGVRLPIAVLWRGRFLPPLTKTQDILSGTPWDSLTGPFAWILEQGIQHGSQRYTGSFPVPDHCSPMNQNGMLQCLHDNGWTWYVTYQPYDRFWLFQGIESAFFLVLAAGLVATTFALVLRRPH